MDFVLPASVKREFDAELANIVRTAQVNSRRLVEKQPNLNVDDLYKHQLLIGIAEWAYERTKGWKVDTKREELSLGKACENKKGECTERTNLLYALVVRAKENLKDEKINLSDVDVKFAQIFDYSSEDHVCLTAEIGGKRKFYDIGAPIATSGASLVSRPYGKSVVVELPEHVAGLLCNKGLEEKGKKADALYVEALRLAPDSAYVKIAAARHYYNMAAECHNRGQSAKAREYQKKSKELMEGIGDLPGASYMTSTLTSLNSHHSALSKII